MNDNSVNGASVVLGIFICLLPTIIFFFGKSVGRSDVYHDCKTFQAFVSNGEKFRCELIKEQ